MFAKRIGFGSNPSSLSEPFWAIGTLSVIAARLLNVADRPSAGSTANLREAATAGKSAIAL